MWIELFDRRWDCYSDRRNVLGLDWLCWDERCWVLSALGWFQTRCGMWGARTWWSQIQYGMWVRSCADRIYGFVTYCWLPVRIRYLYLTFDWNLSFMFEDFFAKSWRNEQEYYLTLRKNDSTSKRSALIVIGCKWNPLVKKIFDVAFWLVFENWANIFGIVVLIEIVKLPY